MRHSLGTVLSVNVKRCELKYKNRFCAYCNYWIGLCSVLRPRQHSIERYMGDGYYRSKDPTNSIKVLKEMLQKRKKTTKTTKYMHRQ